MAKVKSVKFYNFTELKGSYATLINVRFYDINKKLILIDFSNPIKTLTSTYGENSEYIVTSYSGGGYNYKNYPHNSFHIGNKNLNLNIPKIGVGWVPATKHATSNDFLKIEFKLPQYLSKIEILHSYSDEYAVDTMDYDIEFNDGTTKTYNFKSNGKFSPIDDSIMDNFAWNQDELDSVFTEIKFDKSKQIYDSNIGLIKTLNTNNFRNISVDKFEKIKVLYTKPINTYINCLISFDNEQTWKTFNNSNWLEISDVSPENIILNCMSIEILNKLDKSKLIAGGFTGDLDFKIAIKTNSEDVTPSISKIHIEYR